MNESQTVEKFEAWGLLELFGHQRLAGQISEQTIGGVHFIRVDVPAVDGAPAYTRLFTQGAIYGMTILGEATARALAQTLRAKPVSAYDVPQLAAPAGPTRSEIDRAFDDDDSDPDR